ncbi:MAG: hypothetical protein KGQ51_17025 [Planctomycetes bacterium]|nr:hypothetical protein [Planctomycetota bacterium]
MLRELTAEFLYFFTPLTFLRRAAAREKFWSNAHGKSKAGGCPISVQRAAIIAEQRKLNAIYFQVYGIFSLKRHKICARKFNFLGAANFV